MYSFDSRIRYSEVGRDCTMDLSMIINYFQDCCTFQSEDLGNGIEQMTQKHQAWILSSWQIVINRSPRFSEEITTGTWAYNFDRVYGYRNFIMKTKSGEVLAVANSLWLYVDTNVFHPMRITDEIANIYTIEPRYEDMTYEKRRIDLPETLVSYDPFPVLISHLDSNQHVNNGQYISMAEKYLPENFKIRQMRAEYKRQALLGDLIYPSVSVSDTLVTVILSNEQNQPYTIVEFKK